MFEVQGLNKGGSAKRKLLVEFENDFTGSTTSRWKTRDGGSTVKATGYDVELSS